jgi:hypothetical protein
MRSCPHTVYTPVPPAMTGTIGKMVSFPIAPTIPPACSDGPVTSWRAGHPRCESTPTGNGPTRCPADPVRSRRGVALQPVGHQPARTHPRLARPAALHRRRLPVHESRTPSAPGKTPGSASSGPSAVSEPRLAGRRADRPPPCSPGCGSSPSTATWPKPNPNAALPPPLQGLRALQPQRPVTVNDRGLASTREELGFTQPPWDG